MTLREYLRISRPAAPPSGAIGAESEWMAVADLESTAGTLWIGDPQFFWAEAYEGGGCRVDVSVGSYVVEAKGIDFNGSLYVSRLRVVRQGATECSPGGIVGEAETDSAQLGIADIGALKAALAAACGDDEDVAFDLLEEGVDGDIGVFEPQPGHAGRLVYLPSGFGDGGGPVWELVSGRTRIGFEHEMIDATEPC